MHALIVADLAEHSACAGSNSHPAVNPPDIDD
jgi:hypothetical protein